MLKKIFKAAVISAIVAGCATAPQYERPDNPTSASWPKGNAYTISDRAGKASEIAWKDYFKSENMKTLIERTLNNNRDMRVAVLNIQAAQAAYRIQRSESLPTINAGASATRANVPENASTTGAEYTSTSVSANVGVTAYELDFFGRVKNLNQKALESFYATEEAKNSTQLTLIAETANAYLTYLADKKQLKLAENTLEANKKTLEVVSKSFEAGAVSKTDVYQAESTVESSKAAIAIYKRLTAQDKNALVLLTGSSVDDVADSGETIDTISFMENLPEGIPSEVLLSRPDIKAAEHKIKAANADIGAARAAFYPKITLTGSMGLASDSLSTLFQSGSALAWNFTPSVTIPIFNRGRTKANLEVAEVSEKIAAAQYEKALQTAFKEASDQLAARGTYRTQLDAQNAYVGSVAKTYELSELRYKNGVIGFLPLLDAQRSLYAAQQSAISVKQQYLSNLVNLYKVLGGGQI